MLKYFLDVLIGLIVVGGFGVLVSCLKGDDDPESAGALGFIVISIFIMVFLLSIVGAFKAFTITDSFPVLLSSMLFIIYAWYSIFNIREFKKYNGIIPGLSDINTILMFIIALLAIFDYVEAPANQRGEQLVCTIPIYGHCIYAAIRRIALYLMKKNSRKK